MTPPVPPLGLTIHIKRMHKKVEFSFTCGKCGEVLHQEANKINHEKCCNGLRSSDKKKVERSNFARHRKKCEGQEFQMETTLARVYKKGVP
jgi:hypothetical protein